MAAPVLSSLINAAFQISEAVQGGKINLDEAAKEVGRILNAGGIAAAVRLPEKRNLERAQPPGVHEID